MVRGWCPFSLICASTLDCTFSDPSGCRATLLKSQREKPQQKDNNILIENHMHNALIFQTISPLWRETQHFDFKNFKNNTKLIIFTTQTGNLSNCQKQDDIKSIT